MKLLIPWFLRLALSASFLSAVADRLGYWGAPGAPGVAWGDFQNFTHYTGLLNPFAPAKFVPALAWLATFLEVLLALGLVVGWRLKEVALASGALLLLFALSMTFSIGVKGPLDYSVFSAAGAAFALGLLSDKSRR